MERVYSAGEFNTSTRAELVRITAFFEARSREEESVCILSDIDDTLVANTVGYVAGSDPRLPAGTKYPCAEVILSEVYQRYGIPTTIISAYPQNWLNADKIKSAEDATGTEIFFLGGRRSTSWLAALAAIPKWFTYKLSSYVAIAHNKAKNISLFAKASRGGKVYRIFFGDNGQGDVMAGTLALEAGDVDVVFIHVVEPSEESETPLFYFKNYWEVVLKLRELIIARVLPESMIDVVDRMKQDCQLLNYDYAQESTRPEGASSEPTSPVSQSTPVSTERVTPPVTKREEEASTDSESTPDSFQSVPQSTSQSTSSKSFHPGFVNLMRT